MNRTITFRELVKLIHPDLNKSITDPGGKMHTAKLFKEYPEELYKLAVKWGCLGDTPQPTPEPQRTTPQPPRPRPRPRPVPRFYWREFPYEIPRVNGYVFVLTRNRARVMVVKVTAKRVYFYYNGRRTFANRKNVTVAKQVKVN